jgi:hypothetical protein
MNSVLRKSWLAVLFGAGCLTQSAGGMPLPTKSVTARIDGLVLEKPTAAMEGPIRHVFFELDNQDSRIWLQSFKVEVLANGKPAAQYLCHSRLGVYSKDYDLEKLRIIKSDKQSGSLSLISISQGLSEITFPEGYALKVSLQTTHRLLFGAQVQSPLGVPGRQRVEVTATVKYAEGAVAFKELKESRFKVLAGDHSVPHSPDHQFHFSIPPGHNVFESKISREDVADLPETFTIHYMRLHLHAFATSLELFDDTDGRLVWRGNVTTDVRTASVSRADFYSSTQGMRLQRDHDYRIVATYDNTTQETVDGMAVLQFYYD